MAMGGPYDLPYSVELWYDENRHVEELIALTGDYRVARAAFRGGRQTQARSDRDAAAEN